MTSLPEEKHRELESGDHARLYTDESVCASVERSMPERDQIFTTPSSPAVAIAVPSFRLLRDQVTIPKADLTIKATGYAWYWKFTYPQDAGGFEFEVRMLSDEERIAAVKAGKGKEADFPRLLAVDNEVVVPVNKTVAVQVTAGDVLHAFAVPSFAVKADAVPGRLNQTWFRATKEGIFYGQCSELCGKDHAFMPLAIRVVSQEKYDAWLADAKKKYARIGDAPVQTAQTDPVR